MQDNALSTEPTPPSKNLGWKVPTMNRSYLFVFEIWNTLMCATPFPGKSTYLDSNISKSLIVTHSETQIFARAPQHSGIAVHASAKDAR